MQDSLEPDSNVIADRDSQSKKQPWQSLSTDAGRQIDESNPHFANVRASSDERREPDSKVTVESDSHSEKHSSPMFSIDEGMQIDESNEA
jgi:hypothetical protein